MKKAPLTFAVLSFLAVAVVLLSGQDVLADSIDLDLVQTSTLTNVDDAEGRWQYDGGEVRFQGVRIGYYTRTKRVSFGGGSPLNAAAVTLTLFIPGTDPPENVTLQGSHSFNNGDQVGGISAASSGLSFLVGGSFSVESDTLTLEW